MKFDSSSDTPIDPRDLKILFGIDLGERLSLIRVAANMSQAQMADLLGVDQATVFRWERHKLKSVAPPRPLLLIYAIFQGCSVSELLSPRPSRGGDGFQARNRKPEAIVRCLRVMAALGIVRAKEHQADEVSTPEEELVHDLFALLNKT